LIFATQRNGTEITATPARRISVEPSQPMISSKAFGSARIDAI
jgi:hypothetical protein